MRNVHRLVLFQFVFFQGFDLLKTGLLCRFLCLVDMGAMGERDRLDGLARDQLTSSIYRARGHMAEGLSGVLDSDNLTTYVSHALRADALCQQFS